MHRFDDYAYMGVALGLARRAGALGEVPVGAIVVYQGQIIGRGFNLREHRQNPLLHAEMIALEQASQFLSSWRLIDCTLYVTLEPCPMCAGALIQSRVDRVVYGCTDPKGGAVESLYTLLSDTRLNHKAQVKSGCRSKECSTLLTRFFQARRIQNRRRKQS